MNKRNLFNEEQRAFRNTVSKFVEKEILPYHSIWEKDGFVPKELWLKAGKQEFYVQMFLKYTVAQEEILDKT